jgi:hypothetical protein
MVLTVRHAHGFGHHFSDRPSHQLVVLGHHLTGGERKSPKKIEFCNDPQHLSFFHYGERIEVVLMPPAHAWLFGASRSLPHASYTDALCFQENGTCFELHQCGRSLSVS